MLTDEDDAALDGPVLYCVLWECRECKASMLVKWTPDGIEDPICTDCVAKP